MTTKFWNTRPYLWRRMHIYYPAAVWTGTQHGTCGTIIFIFYSSWNCILPHKCLLRTSAKALARAGARTWGWRPSSHSLCLLLSSCLPLSWPVKQSQHHFKTASLFCKNDNQSTRTCSVLDNWFNLLRDLRKPYIPLRPSLPQLSCACMCVCVCWVS